MAAVNVASGTLGAKLVDYSSEIAGCEAQNVLLDHSNLWLTEPGFPQWVCVSLEDIEDKENTVVKTIGFNNWHSYTTNPQGVILHVSKDGHKFRVWDEVEVTAQGKGTNLFTVAPIKVEFFPFIALEITSSFGGLQTYMNRIYMFKEEVPPSPFPTVQHKNKSSDSTFKNNSSTQLQAEFAQRAESNNNDNDNERLDLEDEDEEQDKDEEEDLFITKQLEGALGLDLDHSNDNSGLSEIISSSSLTRTPVGNSNDNYMRSSAKDKDKQHQDLPLPSLESPAPTETSFIKQRESVKRASTPSGVHIEGFQAASDQAQRSLNGVNHNGRSPFRPGPAGSRSSRSSLLHTHTEQDNHKMNSNPININGQQKQHTQETTDEDLALATRIRRLEENSTRLLTALSALSQMALGGEGKEEEEGQAPLIRATSGYAQLPHMPSSASAPSTSASSGSGAEDMKKTVDRIANMIQSALERVEHRHASFIEGFAMLAGAAPNVGKCLNCLIKQYV